jgi:hypothetical protein
VQGDTGINSVDGINDTGSNGPLMGISATGTGDTGSNGVDSINSAT